ncbi:hypothetical protein AcetOrient_orf04870 [Acetobacter orientalis]|uniref:Uncharacterized protein n=1 Tax=Acetobacter orientalis TaxID=146474 RepID=A0A2Z5ZMC8_9PROT|nr:hypothetical protein AcetOrient_orf04870 [Acetobacter orientalis]
MPVLFCRIFEKAFVVYAVLAMAADKAKTLRLRAVGPTMV